MFGSSRGRNRFPRGHHLSHCDLDLELDKLTHVLVHVAHVGRSSSSWTRPICCRMTWTRLLAVVALERADHLLVDHLRQGVERPA
eukprot:100261-Heterocapsa_arctica.AAC.1